jgi:hypothetical protein
MTVRAAIVLGLCLVLAGLVHGGLYSAGHDFVVNRFTGRYQFVPAEGDEEPEPYTAHGVADARPRRIGALTSRDPGAK